MLCSNNGRDVRDVHDLIISRSLRVVGLFGCELPSLMNSLEELAAVVLQIVQQSLPDFVRTIFNNKHTRWLAVVVHQIDRLSRFNHP